MNKQELRQEALTAGRTAYTSAMMDDSQIYEGVINAALDAALDVYEVGLRRSLNRLPDGYAILPKNLTAENGAKSLLMGEFYSDIEISCPACEGDDDCHICYGSGFYRDRVPVSWTTIKKIWRKAVSHFSPQENIDPKLDDSDAQARRLIELLADELEEWPEANRGCDSITQDYDGELRATDAGCTPEFLGSSWSSMWSSPIENPKTGDRRFFLAQSSDWGTAIVTRDQWQAERGRRKVDTAKGTNG